ncbi:hypothetical protein GCM10009555_038210 [Acrocarpospora macrocephala]|uniref:GAF domain-containing protein n=1 Tax=Acrocarpospora macrocephala TaxID=150177 RepID=A0A5M3WKH8_9ACTN|nr:GAF domain-containing protein [Acrocarpospora macrocephala]GES09707.1 hypothetical protein Amac_033030 [Acrocarpospora macrocephala]
MSWSADTWDDGGGPAGEIVERFLSGRLTGQEVRAPILHSWQRCQTAGLTPATFQPRLLEDVDYDNILVRAARPVFDRLRTSVAGTSTSVFLSESSGMHLLRVVGETSLHRALDRVCAVPGFSCAESEIGTNAVGSTLLERRTCQISGNEHFSEKLRDFTAVGEPVRHPLSGHVEGVVCVGAPRERANAEMMAAARRAARAVEQRLFELSTEREQALMRRYLGAPGTRAAIAASRSALRDLCRHDRLALEDAAVNMVAQGRAAVAEIPLSDGRTARLVARPVTDPGEPVGIAVQALLLRR